MRNVLVLVLLTLPFWLSAKPADIRQAEPFKKPFSTAAPLARPVRDLSYLSGNGHFLIHYDTSGYHAVPPEYTASDSVPDFVVFAAQYLEDSYGVLHDSLGFKLPPADHENSPEIDVYFSSYFNSYGETFLESEIETDVWTSYLTLSTKLSDSSAYYTPGLEGLKVTCAHELFHVFQLGYIFRDQDYFYFEMSSVWFEEYMYPEVDDYHSYFNQYSSNWDYAIDHSSLDYNNVGFNLYIDARHSVPGDNIITAIWDRVLSEPALDAIRTVLTARGGGFADALCNWGSAQVLCYPYAAENFAWPFNDAETLPTISFSRYPENVITELQAEVSLSSSPMASYYKITEMPGEAVIFDIGLSEGISAKLICLDGMQSRVYAVGDAPYVIDAGRYEDCILVVGSDREDASARIDLTPAPADLITSLYPNPGSPETPVHIEYVLTQDQQSLRMAVYDLRGRPVLRRDLQEDLRLQGFHTLELDLRSRNLASGIYIFTLRTDTKVLTKKMTFIR